MTENILPDGSDFRIAELKNPDKILAEILITMGMEGWTYEEAADLFEFTPDSLHTWEKHMVLPRIELLKMIERLNNAGDVLYELEEMNGLSITYDID